MEKPTLLIVDDEVTIHVIVKAFIGNLYNLRSASNAQEAIDILSQEPVNIMLLDIQMPDLSGLELLESLMLDSALRDIPVIIFTEKVTEKNKKKALKLGADAFIGKDSFSTDLGKKNLLKQMRKSIEKSRKPAPKKSDHKRKSIEVIKRLVDDVKENDFFHASRRLGANIKRNFDIDYISFWSIENENPNLLMFMGGGHPEDLETENIKATSAYNTLKNKREPYLINNTVSEKKGLYSIATVKNSLSSEIGIPLFKISRRKLTKNKMLIPGDTPIFGFVVLKRNRVFTTHDFKILVRTIQYCGTLLWGLYELLHVKKYNNKSEQLSRPKKHSNYKRMSFFGF